MTPSRDALLVAVVLFSVACTHAYVPTGLMPGMTSQRAPLAEVMRAGHRSPFQLRSPVQRVSVPGRFRNGGKLALRMQDDEWTTVTVKSNTEAAEGLKSITIEVAADIFGSYKTPGQYVKIRKDSAQEKPGFFAIASAPGAGNNEFEFLIKRTDGSAWIADAAKGSTVEMTTAQGKGYKSGIAPLKAVVESGDLKNKSPKLYYGARNEAQMAFQDEFKAWEAKGVEVIPVLSQPDGSWDGKKGYIQDCLKADGISDGSKSAALLCGVNDMVKSAKEVLKEAGVADENVLMNF